MDLGVLLPIVFVFGAIIGSFLNVVILRINTGRGVGGRSACMSCGKNLSWHELIPVISYVIQGRKCRGCKSTISAQYASVEISTAILFTLIFWSHATTLVSGIIPVSLFLLIPLELIIASLLVVIFVYDTRHKIIPDLLVYTFDACALVTVFIGGTHTFHSPHMWTLLAGPILALPFAFLWVISKGRWIGLGDAKLTIGIGWFLGLQAGINALVLAVWIGAIYGILYMLIKHGTFKARVEIPFGPFIILGAFIVLICSINIIDLRMLASLF